MTDNQIKSRLEELSIKAFNFDHKQYREKTGRKFQILRANCQDQTYKQEGKFANFKAGYSTNIDILFVTEEVLNGSPEEFDTILLHELAHCIENSNISSDRSNEGYDLGKYVYGYSNPATEDYTQHTEEFFFTLAEGCINYQKQSSTFKTAEEVIKSAMRFDIDESEGYN